MSARFSIIIPMYNAKDFIIKALSSCINQSFGNIEIIVVDDKSTDESVSIVKELMQKDLRIKLFCNEANLGTFATRNKGALSASGEYLLFLDADDELSLQICERLDELLKHYKESMGENIAIVAFNYYIQNNEGKLKRILYDTNHLFSVKEFILSIAKQGIANHWSLWNKSFLRTAYIKSLQGLDLSQRLVIAEDALNFIVFLLQTQHYATISDTLYIYKQNENSITQRKDKAKSMLSIENHCSVISVISNLSLSNFQRYMAAIFCVELRICILNEKRKLKKNFLNYFLTSFCKKIQRLKQKYYLSSL